MPIWTELARVVCTKRQQLGPDLMAGLFVHAYAACCSARVHSHVRHGVVYKCALTSHVKSPLIHKYNGWLSWPLAVRWHMAVLAPARSACLAEYPILD